MLILASSSPRRIDLLTQWNIPFIAESPDVEEITDAPNPETLVSINASLKAEKIEAEESKLVVGIDTIVALENPWTKSHIFGKPDNPYQAKDMLFKLQGREHLIYSGIQIRYQWKSYSDIAKTKVLFRPLSESEVDSYVETKEGFGKAGAYAIQGQGGTFVQRIDGCFFNAVGFPLASFINLLSKCGLTLSDLRKQ